MQFLTKVRDVFRFRRRTVLGAALFLAISAWLLLVWPTIHRYEKSGSALIRINRFTGRADRLGDSGWKPMETKLWQNAPEFIPDPEPIPIPVSELPLVTFRSAEFRHNTIGYPPIGTIYVSNKSNRWLYGCAGDLILTDGRVFKQKWFDKFQVPHQSDAEESVALDNYPSGEFSGRFRVNFVLMKPDVFDDLIPLLPSGNK